MLWGTSRKERSRTCSLKLWPIGFCDEKYVLTKTSLTTATRRPACTSVEEKVRPRIGRRSKVWKKPSLQIVYLVVQRSVWGLPGIIVSLQSQLSGGISIDSATDVTPGREEIRCNKFCVNAFCISREANCGRGK